MYNQSRESFDPKMNLACSIIYYVLMLNLCICFTLLLMFCKLVIHFFTFHTATEIIRNRYFLNFIEINSVRYLKGFLETIFVISVRERDHEDK